jgi:hypothetical protein
MPILRFQTFVESEVPNILSVYSTDEDGEQFPFDEGDVLLVPLQFILVEWSESVYKILGRFEWSAELFPTGEYDDATSMMLSQVVRTRDNSVQILRTSVDKDNYLSAYLTVEEEEMALLYNESDTIVTPLRVEGIYRVPGAELGLGIPAWGASLIPQGTQGDHGIVCKVERIPA